MTTLYMKQKVFSWKDRFSVVDSDGEDCYQVEGEFPTLAKKLHVYDRFGEEVAFIQQKLWALLPRFQVYLDGELMAEITKELSFLKPKYRIDGPGWSVDGDFLSHEYVITEQGEPVVQIRKAWFTWGDSYEIDIADGIDEPLAVAVVLAIDCVMEQQAAAAAASS